MSTINVRLKDASGNVLHPETDWSVVLNKPTSYLTTWGEVQNKPSFVYRSYNVSDQEQGEQELEGITDPAVEDSRNFYFSHTLLFSDPDLREDAYTSGVIIPQKNGFTTTFLNSLYQQDSQFNLDNLGAVPYISKTSSSTDSSFTSNSSTVVKQDISLVTLRIDLYKQNTLNDLTRRQIFVLVATLGYQKIYGQNFNTLNPMTQEDFLRFAKSSIGATVLHSPYEKDSYSDVLFKKSQSTYKIYYGGEEYNFVEKTPTTGDASRAIVYMMFPRYAEIG